MPSLAANHMETYATLLPSLLLFHVLFYPLGETGKRVEEPNHALVAGVYPGGPLFSTTGSHRSLGPEFCTLGCFERIMHASLGGWFSAVLPG